MNVIDEHKGNVPSDGSERYRPFVVREPGERPTRDERSPLIVRSLRSWGAYLVRLADRLETA